MSDRGKTDAIAILRAEVGFGCPVCRSPFLTWHHFDPPEHIEKHWRPEGMIALCLNCHPNADGKGYGGDAYSPEELRAMKRRGYAAEDVRASFPSWQKKSILVRVGGCYATPSKAVISVNDIPQIALSRNAAGLLSLSFQLRNRDDAILVEMEDNWFTAYPGNIHDMTVTPKTREIKVWLDKEDVGLELSFNRISMEELEDKLELDSQAAKAVFDRIEQARRQEALNQIAPEHREDWLQMMGELWATIDKCKDDPVRREVMRWVSENCQMDDGLIPFLNFEQMAIYFHGHRITIKDGVSEFIHYCAALEMRGAAFNIRCPCPTCSPTSN